MCSKASAARPVLSVAFPTTTAVRGVRLRETRPTTVEAAGKASEVDLLRHGEGVVDFDAQVAHGALQLAVAEQELTGA